jgi:hypothetical protein
MKYLTIDFPLTRKNLNGVWCYSRGIQILGGHWEIKLNLGQLAILLCNTQLL